MFVNAEERLSAEKQKQKEMQREIEASKLKEVFTETTVRLVAVRG